MARAVGAQSSGPPTPSIVLGASDEHALGINENTNSTSQQTQSLPENTQLLAARLRTLQQLYENRNQVGTKMPIYGIFIANITHRTMNN